MILNNMINFSLSSFHLDGKKYLKNDFNKNENTIKMSRFVERIKRNWMKIWNMLSDWMVYLHYTHTPRNTIPQSILCRGGNVYRMAITEIRLNYRRRHSSQSHLGQKDNMYIDTNARVGQGRHIKLEIN